WEQALKRSESDKGEQARATLEKIALFAGLGTNNQRTTVPLVRHSLAEGGSPPNQSWADWKPTLFDQLDYEKDFYPATMEALLRCNSWIAIVMITDLLAREYRFNVPGTKANLNWTRRIQRSIAKLRSSRKERKRMGLIHQILERTGR